MESPIVGTVDNTAGSSTNGLVLDGAGEGFVKIRIVLGLEEVGKTVDTLTVGTIDGPVLLGELVETTMGKSDCSAVGPTVRNELGVPVGMLIVGTIDRPIL